MKKHIILFCTTLLSMQSSIYAMDLREALSSAYNTNENLKSAQQKFLSEAEAFPQALSRFLPDVSMEVRSTTQKQTNVGRSAPGSQEVGPDVSRSMNVQQNLFRGGQDAYAIKIAQAGFAESKATFYSAEQKILTDSLKAYLDFCSSRAKYDIALTAVEFYSQALEMTRERLKVGESTITEVAAAEAQVARANSNKSQQFANFLSAKAAFKTMIGVDATDDVVFPSSPGEVPDTIDDFRAVVEKSNFDLMAAKSKMAQSKDTVKYTKGALLPKVDLAVSEGRNYYDSEANRADKNNSRSVSTVVSMRIPILSNGGTDHSKIRQSKAQSRQAVYVLDYARKQVSASVIGTWESFVSMKDAMTSAQEAIRAQTLALEGVRSEYSVGTKTMLEVLKQQDELNQIKSQAVDIQTQYLAASYQIKALMGQMTAKQLKLDVKYFNPDAEFRNVKHKIVGF